jgi:hypothetical protein
MGCDEVQSVTLLRKGAVSIILGVLWTDASWGCWHGDAEPGGAGEGRDVPSVEWINLPSVQFDESSNGSKAVILYSSTPAWSLQALEPGFVAQNLSTEPVKRLASVQADTKLPILMPAYAEERRITRAIDEMLSAEYSCDVE